MRPRRRLGWQWRQTRHHPVKALLLVGGERVGDVYALGAAGQRERPPILDRVKGGAARRLGEGEHNLALGLEHLARAAINKDSYGSLAPN